MIDNPLSYVLVRPNIINEHGINELLSHIKASSSTDYPSLIHTNQMKLVKRNGL